MVPVWPTVNPVPPNMLGGLRSIQDSMQKSAAAIGQPTPGPSTMRSRLGSTLMRWIGRIMWWYTHEIQAAFYDAQRHQQEESRVLESVTDSHNAVVAGVKAAYHEADAIRNSVQGSVRELQASIQELGQGLKDCTTTIQVLNSRCGEMEAAQVKLQARQIEQSVVNSMARVDRIASDMKESLSSHQASTNNELNVIRREISTIARSSTSHEAALARLAEEAAVEKQGVGKGLEKPGRSLRVQIAGEVDARVEMGTRLAALDDLVARLAGELGDRTELSGQAARSAGAIAHFEHSFDQRLQAGIARSERRIDELHTELAAEVKVRISAIEDLRARLSADAGVSTDVALHTAPAAGITARLEQILGQRLEAEAGRREELSVRLADLGQFTYQTRTELTLQARRISLLLEQARKSLSAPSHESASGVLALSDSHKYDALYLAFEDIFRGTQDDIKYRQSFYLPVLKQADIGSRRMPVLDLGSGRGAWLELLRDNGMQARGVDSNLAMAEQCALSGLSVTQGDALCHLRGLPDSSVGAITSFHMIEHLPFEEVLELVDEALRVLKPGGLLILETPNPRNLQVGAFTFYFDPRHVRPLPSGMLGFFVEARGFCDVRIEELHPFPEAVRLSENGNGVAHRVNEHLYGPQDYAVIGKRP